MANSQRIPDERPLFRKILSAGLKSLIGSLVALLILISASCIIQSNPSLKRKIYGPDHLASITLELDKSTIGVELTNASPIGKAEYERRLIVIGSDGSRMVINLAYDHGGFAAANLYRMIDGKIVLANALEAQTISFSPLRITPYSESYLGNRDKGLYGQAGLHDKQRDRKRFGDFKESKYFSNLFYVGSFRFKEKSTAAGKRDRVWSFVPAPEGEEFIQDPGG